MTNAEKIGILIADYDHDFSVKFEELLKSKESYFYNKKKKILLEKAQKILYDNFDSKWNNLETSELEKLLFGTSYNQGIFSKYLHGLKENYFDKTIINIEKEIDMIAGNPFVQINETDLLLKGSNISKVMYIYPEENLDKLYLAAGKVAVGLQYGFYQADISGMMFASPNPKISIKDAKEIFQKILNAKFGEEEIIFDSKLKSLYNYI